MVLAHQTDQVVMEGQPATVKQVNFDISTATTTELVPMVENKKIRIIALTINCADVQKIQFKSGNTNIGGPFNLIAGGTIDSSRLPPNWFCETAVDKPLNLKTFQAVQTSGSINFIEV